ncbi:hypothetical protein EVAR_10775_1 [Eumeta japonica]|uniref:Uncharacterized protein n=1 Tax=Eumeta variegata TaxID=151549 RepID=A0A4C1W9J4_EUMVA|nr:hypothetical protein EVAR_10775_1 [Eumeta japonica]
MTAYCVTNGLVALDKEQMDRTEIPKYITPSYNPIVITARCTKVALEERILEVVKTVTKYKASSDAREGWVMPSITWVNGVLGCGKERIPYHPRIRKGRRDSFLTIHEAQGLTSEGTVIVWIAVKHKLQGSVLHAVVAITRHIVSCVYYTDDGEDAIGRFIERAVAASENKIEYNNAKMAIRIRDNTIMNIFAENWK